MLAYTDLFFRDLKYALYLKDSLDKSLQDLESWYRRWDPSCLLLARLAGSSIDIEIRQQSMSVGVVEGRGTQALAVVGELRKAHQTNAQQGHHPFAFLSSSIRLDVARPLPFSPAVISHRSDTGGLVVVDKVQCQPGANQIDTAQDVQTLARVLSTLDPLSCNLLACEGVQKSVDQQGDIESFSLMFRIPDISQKAYGSSTPLQDTHQEQSAVCIFPC